MKGAGKLMKLAADWGRATRPDTHVGICGEYGGHAASISFCAAYGLDACASAARLPAPLPARLCMNQRPCIAHRSEHVST